MISKDPSGSRYKLWQFNCRTVDRGGSDHRRSGGETAKEIWTIMSVESYDPEKIKKLLEQKQQVVQSHLHSGSLQNVLSTHWLLSKTGEVDPTKFKQDKKAAIAKFLAKSVEGGEVVEIRDVSSTSVMINSCYDMPKTSHGLGAYACLGLGSNLIRVSSGELIAKPAYIQSPVDIKLSCPSRGICTSMQ